MKRMIASRFVSENFCGGIAEPGVTDAGARKCFFSHSGERRAPTLSSSGIDQRLVALYIYDQFGCIGGCHFRHPVGTRAVVRARHTHRRAEAARGGGDAFIVGGDNDAGQVTGLGGAFEYMLQHRLGADSSERLAWETGRSVTRRDNRSEEHTSELQSL